MRQLGIPRLSMVFRRIIINWTIFATAIQIVAKLVISSKNLLNFIFSYRNKLSDRVSSQLVDLREVDNIDPGMVIEGLRGLSRLSYGPTLEKDRPKVFDEAPLPKHDLNLWQLAIIFESAHIQPVIVPVFPGSWLFSQDLRLVIMICALSYQTIAWVDQ